MPVQPSGEENVDEWNLRQCLNDTSYSLSKYLGLPKLVIPENHVEFSNNITKKQYTLNVYFLLNKHLLFLRKEEALVGNQSNIEFSLLR